MSTFKIDFKKRKKLLKNTIKGKVRKQKGFIKFCYILELLLKISAFVFGVGNIIYVLLGNASLTWLVFCIVTFGFPFGLSLLPRTVYVMTLGGEYRFRIKESLTLREDGLFYSYHDSRSNSATEVFSYNVEYEKITNAEYDNVTGVFTMYGAFTEDTYHRDILIETNEWSEISLLNAYNVDIASIVLSKINRR